MTFNGTKRKILKNLVLINHQGHGQDNTSLYQALVKLAHRYTTQSSSENVRAATATNNKGLIVK